MPVFRLGRRIRQVIRNEAGLTLVELLTVLALLGIVLGCVYQYFFYAHNSLARTFAETRAIQDARLNMARMTREIQEAQVAREGVGAVELISANEIRIYTNVEGDARPEMVCYRLQNGALERGVAAPQNDEYPYTYGSPANWQTVAGRVDNNGLFSIPDLDGNPATPNAREIVSVELAVNDPLTLLAQPLRIQFTATVRNREETE